VTPDTRFRSAERGLDPAWLDYNGHLNMAYYNVLFDNAVDELLDALGCGATYRRSENRSFFTAQAHVSYLRELKPDARVSVAIRILDVDRKRIHLFKELVHAEGWLSATSENLMLHVDMDGPKVTPMADDLYARIEAMAASQADLPRDPRIGRAISIRKG
jgi:Predicted thioesterase